MGLISHLKHEIDGARMKRWNKLAVTAIAVHAAFGFILMEDYSMHLDQSKAFRAYVCYLTESQLRF